MRKSVLVLSMFLLGAAHAANPPKLNQQLLREAMESVLKDADSAKFKNIRYAEASPDSWTMCGEVNAKNSYGGYAGFETFAAMAFKEGGKAKYFVLRVGGVSDEFCANYGL